MEQIALIGIGILYVVGVLYALWGCIEAGAGWKNWLVDAVLPFYGLVLLGLIALLVLFAVVAWAWRVLFI